MCEYSPDLFFFRFFYIYKNQRLFSGTRAILGSSSQAFLRIFRHFRPQKLLGQQGASDVQLLCIIEALAWADLANENIIPQATQDANPICQGMWWEYLPIYGFFLL